MAELLDIMFNVKFGGFWSYFEAYCIFVYVYVCVCVCVYVSVYLCLILKKSKVLLLTLNILKYKQEYFCLQNEVLNFHLSSLSLTHNIIFISSNKPISKQQHVKIDRVFT